MGLDSSSWQPYPARVEVRKGYGWHAACVSVFIGIHRYFMDSLNSALELVKC